MACWAAHHRFSQISSNAIFELTDLTKMYKSFRYTTFKEDERGVGLQKLGILLGDKLPPNLKLAKYDFCKSCSSI